MLFFCQRDNRTGEIKKRNLDREPCFTIAAQGVGDSFASDYWLEEDKLENKIRLHENKPPYSVPSMVEIQKIKDGGYKVASTFSGTGGSCLGYRMAGMTVIWANEMEPHAAKCYALNHPETILDIRNIRSIKPAEILEAIRLEAGVLDLFDGSPPCQSFSTAGKREKGWGKSMAHGDGTTQRSDDLFFEYARILKGLQPKTFVAENVSGLIKGTAIGYFKEILAALKACGYVVQARLLDAQWLGVPQMRQRIIFVGIREDLAKKFDIQPVYPKPLKYRYSFKDAIDADIIGIEGYNFGDIKRSAREPSMTICSDSNQQRLIALIATHELKTERRKFTIAELKRICSFPDDFQLIGSYAKQWARLGNSVPPVMMLHIASAIRDQILNRVADSEKLYGKNRQTENPNEAKNLTGQQGQASVTG